MKCLTLLCVLFGADSDFDWSERPTASDRCEVGFAEELPGDGYDWSAWSSMFAMRHGTTTEPDPLDSLTVEELEDLIVKLRCQLEPCQEV